MSASDHALLRELDDPKLDALVETMFLAAHADGEFSDEERQHFISSVESLTDQRLGGEALDQLVARIEGAIASGGRAARLSSVKERLPDPNARKVALSLAIRVVASDGLIRTSERELILEAAEALDIDRDVAADLVRELTSRAQ